MTRNRKGNKTCEPVNYRHSPVPSTLPKNAKWRNELGLIGPEGWKWRDVLEVILHKFTEKQVAQLGCRKVLLEHWLSSRFKSHYDLKQRPLFWRSCLWYSREPCISLRHGAGLSLGMKLRSDHLWEAPGSVDFSSGLSTRGIARSKSRKKWWHIW